MSKKQTIQIGDCILDSNVVSKLLDQFAHRIYVDKYQEQLSSLLQQDRGVTRTGLTLDEFFRVNVGSGKIFAGYSGPCKDANIKAQEDSIGHLAKDLNDVVGGIVHGATMWAFIKEAHLSAVRNNMLSIGVMP